MLCYCNVKYSKCNRFLTTLLLCLKHCCLWSTLLPMSHSSWDCTHFYWLLLITEQWKQLSFLLKMKWVDPWLFMIVWTWSQHGMNSQSRKMLAQLMQNSASAISPRVPKSRLRKSEVWAIVEFWTVTVILPPYIEDVIPKI